MAATFCLTQFTAPPAEAGLNPICISYEADGRFATSSTTMVSSPSLTNRFPFTFADEEKGARASTGAGSSSGLGSGGAFFSHDTNSIR